MPFPTVGSRPYRRVKRPAFDMLMEWALLRERGPGQVRGRVALTVTVQGLSASLSTLPLCLR